MILLCFEQVQQLRDGCLLICRAVALEAFFGPYVGTSQDMRADDALAHETYNLPEAFKGRNKFLERVLDYKIRQEDEFYTRSLLPWDEETVADSVRRTGRLIVSHEAPITGGFAAEIASKIQQTCFLSLEAPIRRVCGYDTPFPLVFEKLYVPDHLKLLEAIKETVSY